MNNDSGRSRGEDPSATYYDGDTFDDMIAYAMDSNTINDGVLGRLESTKRATDMDDDDADVDLEELSEGGGGVDDASLDSSDISGESTINEVSSKAMPYNAQPLVNDDESTLDMRPPAPEVSTVSSYVDQLNQYERSKGKFIKAGVCAVCIAIIVGVVLVVIAATGNKDPAPANQNPSSAPVMIPFDTNPIETIHHVQLTLQNIPDGPLPADYRASIVGFIEELLKESIGESLEVLEVADAGGGGGTSRSLVLSRRLETYLQLRIVMGGPSNYSEDDVRSYVVGVIKARSEDVVAYMKALDSDTFKNVTLSVDTFDATGLMVPTASPSLSPQTEVPTATQTTESTALPSLSPQTEMPNLRTPSPSLYPEVTTKAPTTIAPNTKSPTNKPSLRPTRIPIPLTLPVPTPSPLQSGGSIISPYGTASDPVGSPTTTSDGSVNQGTVLAPVSGGPSNSYFCAKTSYTENWNIMLEFNCELGCPSMAHTDCPEGHQCSLSEYCGSLRS
ncbi:hypothetical protein ACHAW5_008730 [Stephanodiscus triporus]|uniref:SEA domain-containing protein n=1 Tax=Stephanodiscus triporus TaxID=2934178 RepID=A0ABD3NHF9_9STRA